MSIAAVRERVRDAALATVTSGRTPCRQVALPPRRLRAGGAHFRTDEAFVASAVDEAGWLVERGLVGPDRALLDFGCGAGRLAIGLLEAGVATRQYLGVDVRSDVVAWARRHLAGRAAGMSFIRVDARNRRYNPDGQPLESTRLPVSGGSFDVAYAYSVFSHLERDDAAVAFEKLRQALVPGGALVVTAFVEDGVPDVVENPSGYGPLAWTGALHCVRFSRRMFETLASDAGFTVRELVPATETDGQSRYRFEAT
jgi:SAM-dependent methyltransferase